MSLGTQRSTVGFVEEIDHNELDFGQVVGRGAFGVVQRATWRGLNVAVKQIETENEKRAFVTELKQLSRVNHENIVKLYGASTKYPVFLVMEFAECGSLYNLLHGIEHTLIEYNASHAISWTLQTALGVSYLHNIKPKAIIHRDLKPPNLLLVKRGKILKLCDFGTAADAQTHMTNNKGSAAWMAPEVFEGNKYSEKCDVFSWGIVLWECLARKKPFDEVGGPAFRIMWAVHSGTRPPLLKDMPKSLEKLMVRCWSKNPVDRPSMDEETLTPLAFPGQFIDEGQIGALSNESESLRIDDILNASTGDSSSSIDAPDRVSTTRSNSRAISHRDSEEVVVEPLHIEPPLIAVEETERHSLRRDDMNSLATAEDSVGNIYSPRHIVKTGNGGCTPKRKSADVETLFALMENASLNESPKPSPRRFGHRRVGSHGNPPININIETAVNANAQSYFGRMSSSSSHPGEYISERVGDGYNHSHLHHSQSYDNTMMAAATPPHRPSRTSEPQSTPTPPPSLSLLDEFLKPLPPLANSNQSMLIYYEHVTLAENYMKLQQETANARGRVAALRRKLEEERAVKQRSNQLMQEVQRLADENEDYMKLKQSLEQQLGEPGHQFQLC